MKKYLFYSIPFLVVMLVTGLICRFSIHQTNLDDYNVAFIWEQEKDESDDAKEESSFNLVDNVIEVWQEDLNPEMTPYVFTATCLSEPVVDACVVDQLVRVEKVISGDDVTEGEEFYLSSYNVGLMGDAETEHELNRAVTSLNMGFTNFMKVGKEYLVFVQYFSYSHELKKQFAITGEALATTYFALEDDKCEPVSKAQVVDDETGHYVKYSDVKDYEYFVGSEEIKKKLYDEKHKIIEKYLRDAF
ncbi:hypothetical protein [Agathobacter ruminis]|uniref:Uncharacterized protein n=1 Tax=Agathobacter ruminis TaxID=1712665 RepID=A0A2G3DZF5_9FIRM|nr:hypothetical protein [Agathobacter ruminis]MDC7300690.1 hypothetical protein [Agathobacter ruminis]PHU36416.1 hypothetical protein CSX02_12610 [Agathobacter ruminis]